MPETNVRIPQCAADALDQVVEHRGLSRDATVRQLLAEYIEDQRRRSGGDYDDSDNRLTHIATMMRYPTPAGRGKPKAGVQLRLRLPENAAEEAKQLAFSVPGQSRARGHRDYQARRLTDAVMTAIARVQPFSDTNLEGIKPLIRQRTARGLWRLVVASTLSGSEFEILENAYAEKQKRDQDLRKRRAVGPVGPASRLAHELQEGDQAWHGVRRRLAANSIARALLSGPKTEQMDRILYNQDDRDTEWPDLLIEHQRLLRADGAIDSEGRGAGLVWRARRKLYLADLHTWLVHTEVAPPPKHLHALVMEPPGWTLILPPTWQPYTLASTETLDNVWADHLSSGRVLDVTSGSKRLLWPTILTPRGRRPVPGFELITKHAGPLKPELLVEMILRHFPSPHDTDLLYVTRPVHYPGDDSVPINFDRPIPVPARIAHKLGLIDSEERDRLINEAIATNQHQMERVIAAVSTSSDERYKASALRTAMKANDLTAFSKITAKTKQKFGISKPDHFVEGTSLARQLDAGSNPAMIAWLTGYLVSNTKWCLDMSMEATSKRAFARFHALTASTGPVL